MNIHPVVLSNELRLIPIEKTDHQKLQNLMSVVYPPPYIHLWKDDGSWYLEMVYNLTNFEKEIEEGNTPYYFVHYQSVAIGILRVCHSVPLIDSPEKKASKLHRIYLDQSVHGKGIGKILLKWVEEKCGERGDEILWLEAMDSQKQALNFYESNGFEICGSMRLDFEVMLPEYRGMHRMFKKLNK